MTIYITFNEYNIDLLIYLSTFLKDIAVAGIVITRHTRFINLPLYISERHRSSRRSRYMAYPA